MQIYNFSPGISIHFYNFSPRIRSSVATFRPDVMQRYYRLNSQTNLCNVCKNLDLSIVLLARMFYAVALQNFLVFNHLEAIRPVRKRCPMETVCRMPLDSFLGSCKSLFTWSLSRKAMATAFSGVQHRLISMKHSSMLNCCSTGL